MKKPAVVMLIPMILMACSPSGNSSTGHTDSTVTPATDTSASSKLKNYTAPEQEDRLRKVSPDTAQKPQ